MKTSKAQKVKKLHDYNKEYNDLFKVIGVNPTHLRHEWEREGDIIKECSLYEDHPTPKITPNTHSI